MPYAIILIFLCRNNKKYFMDFDLSNKSAVITGAGGLLGQYHAQAFLQFGANVVLLDRNKKGLDKTLLSLSKFNENKIFSFVCDASDEKKVLNISKKLIKEKININILVNNSANNPKMKKLLNNKSSNRFEDFNVDSIDDDIRAVIYTTLVCSKVFGTIMASKGSGSIINIASDLAIQAPDQRVYHKSEKMEKVKNFKPISYSVVKSSMLGITKYISTYWAHKNVRCNTLIPGAVLNNQPKELIKNVIKRVPLRRWADVKDYQGALVFLASEASSYMTGQELIIDGGRSVW